MCGGGNTRFKSAHGAAAATTIRPHTSGDSVLSRIGHCKLTWLVLGGDPAARSHRVEQLTAL